MTDRPYPPTSSSWVMHQRWHDLLFAHWPVSPKELRLRIPPPLDIDLFQGEAWLGVVPFWMSNVRPRGIPPVPGVSQFLELNVRTYVRFRGKPGVFFFSLDASNPVAVRLARSMYHLPYFDAAMRMDPSPSALRKLECAPSPENPVHYFSRRRSPAEPSAELQVRYWPTAFESIPAPPDSLPWWLTARYCLYTASRDGRLFCGEIHHAPWPLQPAAAEFATNTMAAPTGITLPDTPPLLYFSRVLDVQIWPLAQCAL